MKRVNKDYISVVRDTNEGLLFERIPMQKSAAALATLYKMAQEDAHTAGLMARNLIALYSGQSQEYILSNREAISMKKKKI